MLTQPSKLIVIILLYTSLLLSQRIDNSLLFHISTNISELNINAQSLQYCFWLAKAFPAANILLSLTNIESKLIICKIIFVCLILSNLLYTLK